MDVNSCFDALEICCSVVALFFIIPFTICGIGIKRFFLLFILLIPNIIDFILTFLDYKDYKNYIDSENSIKSYFIIRFIYQGLYIYFCFTLIYAISSQARDGDPFPFIPFFVMIIVMIIFEIICLVNFIKHKNDLASNSKFGYYIHFFYILAGCCYFLSKGKININ